jgi:hypothetical protein
MNKGVYMKKLSFIAFVVFLTSIALCIPSFSANMDDIDGTWNTYSKAKLKISSVGSFTDENPSTTTLNVNGNLTLVEDSWGGPYTYTGTFNIIDGKKLSIALDVNGVNELIDTWTNWAQEIAADKGVTVSDIDFSIESLTISQPSINKKTFIPKKTTLKAKGLVRAQVNGEPFLKKFSYSSKVNFIGR